MKKLTAMFLSAALIISGTLPSFAEGKIKPTLTDKQAAEAYDTYIKDTKEIHKKYNLTPPAVFGLTNTGGTGISAAGFALASRHFSRLSNVDLLSKMYKESRNIHQVVCDLETAAGPKYQTGLSNLKDLMARHKFGNDYVAFQKYMYQEHLTTLGETRAVLDYKVAKQHLTSAAKKYSNLAITPQQRYAAASPELASAKKAFDNVTFMEKEGYSPVFFSNQNKFSTVTEGVTTLGKTNTEALAAGGKAVRFGSAAKVTIIFTLAAAAFTGVTIWLSNAPKALSSTDRAGLKSSDKFLFSGMTPESVTAYGLGEFKDGYKYFLEQYISNPESKTMLEADILLENGKTEEAKKLQRSLEMLAYEESGYDEDFIFSADFGNAFADKTKKLDEAALYLRG